MTTVITRLYEDERKAQFVKNRLKWEGFPRNAVRIVTVRAGEPVDNLRARLLRSEVDPDAASVYADRVAHGNALLVIHATYKPLGAARIAREVIARSSAPIDVGSVNDDFYIPDGPDHAPSVLKDHPRFLTLPFEPEDYEGGPVTAELGMPMLSDRRPGRSAMRGGGFMSRMFWPMPLITRNRKARSAISGGAHMSRMFWPMPLLSSKRRTNSVIRGGALPFSRALGWPTISSRS